MAGKLQKLAVQTALAGGGAIGATYVGKQVMETFGKGKDTKTQGWIAIGVGAALLFFGNKIRQPGLATGAAAMFLAQGGRAIMDSDKDKIAGGQSTQQSPKVEGAQVAPLPPSTTQGAATNPLIEVVIQDAEGDRQIGYFKDLGSIQHLYLDGYSDPLATNSITNGLVSQMFRPENIRVQGRPLVTVFEFNPGFSEGDVEDDPEIQQAPEAEVMGDRKGARRYLSYATVAGDTSSRVTY